MYRLIHGALFAHCAQCALLTLALAGLAAGCGDDGPGDGSAGMAGDGSGDPNGFGAIHDEILVPYCTTPSCHGGNAGNLNLSTRALAYANLVGVTASGPSCAAMGLSRVVRGDSAASLLVTKLDVSAAPCGVPMPVGGMLSAADVARIAAWVDAGAPDN